MEGLTWVIIKTTWYYHKNNMSTDGTDYRPQKLIHAAATNQPTNQPTSENELDQSLEKAETFNKHGWGN